MVSGAHKIIDKLRDAITRNDTAFDTRIADNTSNRIDASGTYTFNIGRHFFLDDLNTNGGTFIRDPANTDNLDDLAAKFQVTANAGEEHLFGARELVRYVPNYELLFGAAAWAESVLQSGQHYAVEFGDDTFVNGYRYHFEGGDPVTLTLEQNSGGTTVDSIDGGLSEREIHGYAHERPAVPRGFLNWYGAGLARYTVSHTATDDSGDVFDQKNPELGRTANTGDVATEESNLRVQVRVWAESGADPVTVNVCSMGALIRGNAAEVDREKPAVQWTVGGDISQYPTDNVSAAIAARIDPDRDNVAVKAEPPIFEPAGSGVTMELGVYAVHNEHADLTVNFDDPDDDGTDEGPSPAAQALASTDVMQYTRDVTSIPTTTDIRADATEGLVPDMRHLTSTVGASGGGNNPGTTSGGELAGVKRNVYPDDVVIFLPRTDPAGNTSSGTIQWLKPLFEQDW